MFRMLHAYQRNAEFFHSSFCQLGLAEQCNTIRSNLLIAITNEEIFSKRLTSQLKPFVPGVPYHVNSDDPEQIVIIKKVMNILYNMETIFTEIEELDINSEDYLAEAPLAKNIYHALMQAQDAWQLIDTGGVAIQTIFGPQLERLKPRLDFATERLQQFSSSANKLEERVVETTAKGINLLPTEQKTKEEVGFEQLAQTVLNIPVYFKQLQRIIESESLFPSEKITTSEAYQQVLEVKAKKIAHNMEQMTTRTGLSLAYKYAQVIKKIGVHGTDFINAGSPLTKTAYLKSVEKLQQFKHQILPEVIAELESLEENLGLISGTLTEPALSAALNYYKSMTKVVEKIGFAVEKIETVESGMNKWYGKAGQAILLGKVKKVNTGPVLEQDEEVAVLMDDVFREQRRNLQIQRINNSRAHLHEISQSEQAATAFFQKVFSLNTVYSSRSFSRVSVEDRQELAYLYKQFQPCLAAQNPELDTKIVNFLNLNAKEKEEFQKEKQSLSTISYLWGGVSNLVSTTTAVGTAFTRTNEFNMVLEGQAKVIEALQREKATEKQRIAFIEDSMQHVEKSNYVKNGNKTVLKEITSLPKWRTFADVPGESAQELRKKIILIDNELDEVNQALQAFDAFTHKLEQLNVDSLNPFPIVLNNLSTEEKELLRSEYKKFQKFIFYLSKENSDLVAFDTQLVNALGDIQEDESVEKLTNANVFAAKNAIKNYLLALQTKSTRDKEDYLKLENAASKKSSALIELQPVAAKKKTLLAIAKELKLSAKLEDYLHKKLIPNLQENLSQQVLYELHLNSMKLPYPTPHLAPRQVALYMNVINAFYYLQQGLAKLEEATSHKGSKYAISQAYSLGKLGKEIGTSIYQAVLAINGIKGNSQLNEILNQGLELIEPLKKIPLLGSYFAVGSQPAKPDKKQERMDKVTKAFEEFQLSLVNLVNGISAQQLPEQYADLRKEFEEKWLGQLASIEYSLEMEEGTLVGKCQSILEATEIAIKQEVEVLDPILGQIVHPEWETMSKIYDQLEEKLKKIDPYAPLDSSVKAEILALYDELKPYLDKLDDSKFTTDFISNITSVEDLDLAVRKLLDTESKFNPPGIWGEMQHILYFETDYADSIVQERIKNLYKQLQPYLEQVNPIYKDNNFINNLNSSADYENALIQIVNHDGKKMVALLNKQKLTRSQSILLSATHQLQSFAKQTEALFVEKTTKKEPEKSEVQDSQKSVVIRQIVEGLYGLQMEIQRLREKKNNGETGAQSSASAEFNLNELELSLQVLADMSDEIDSVVAAIAEVDFKPVQIGNFLNAIKTLQTLLINAGAEGHDLIIERLKDIRTEFGAEILMQADEVEVTLGLKPGVLTSKISHKFDDFYNKLAKNISGVVGQNILVFSLDTTPTEKRIAKEKERLIHQSKLSSDRQFRDKLLGGKNHHFDEINQIYQCIEDLELHKYEDIAILREKYQKLLPYIEKKTITIELVKGIKNNRELQDVLEEIQFRIIRRRAAIISKNSAARETIDTLYDEVERLSALSSQNETFDPAHRDKLVELLNNLTSSLPALFKDEFPKPPVIWNNSYSLNDWRSWLLSMQEGLTRENSQPFDKLKIFQRQLVSNDDLFKDSFVRKIVIQCCRELAPQLKQAKLYDEADLQRLEQYSEEEIKIVLKNIMENEDKLRTLAPSNERKIVAVNHIYEGVASLNVHQPLQVKILKEKYELLVPHIQREGAAITVESIGGTFVQKDFCEKLEKIQSRIIKNHAELIKRNPTNKDALNAFYLEIGTLLNTVNSAEKLTAKHKEALIKIVGKYNASFPVIFASDISVPRVNWQSTKDIAALKLELIKLESLLTKGKMGIFEKLEILKEEYKTNADLFDDPLVRTILIECYQQLTPELCAINRKGNIFYEVYISKLKAIGFPENESENESDVAFAKEEFKNAFSSLLEYEPALRHQIRVSEITDEKSIQLINEKIDFLESKLDEERENRIKEIEKYKEEKFNECLQNSLKKILDKNLDIYSDIFYKDVRPMLEKYQSKFLERITINDNIEEKMLELFLMEIDKNRTPKEAYKPHIPILDKEERTEIQQVYRQFKFYSLMSTQEHFYHQKEELTEEVRKKSPLAQEKLDFMVAHERNVLTFVKTHREKENYDEMAEFYRTLHIYDDLIQAYALVEKLENGLKKELGTQLPETYVHWGYHKRLCLLRARIQDSGYQYNEQDKLIFAEYYEKMQPDLVDRNNKYTPNYFQIDNVETLRNAVIELTPDLNEEAKTLGKQMEIVSTFKKMMKHSNMPIEQRRRVTHEFLEEQLRPTFSSFSMVDWIKNILIELKNIFVKDVSHSKVKEFNKSFKDRLQNIKPHLESEDDSDRQNMRGAH
ncbi:hypothetical protein [Legionella cardiaca]|uniref:Protein SdhB n=1 Tax=Legionella cardiaca TaxID=1071983 RepID=A0ABY8AX00_9GAMM|nr:hypothetical protein [Legionella cardiaca]WED44020.1 hypothetical protein PXX05_04335 [Legionella cardiaca]